MKTIFFLLFWFPFSSYSQIITTCAGNGTSAYAGDGGQATNAELVQPFYVYIDNNDNLLICHSGIIRKVITLTGVIYTIFGNTSTSAIIGDGGSATSTFTDFPYSVCSDAAGNLYVADNLAGEVRKIDNSTGIVSDYAGIYNTAGSSGDGGPATAAKLAGPFGICIDTMRNALYFSDEYNYKIRKVDMVTGIISTFAGTGVNGYSSDGILATNAKISRALGICLDKFGNLYIADWDNERIRRVDISTGIISSYAGNGTAGSSGDGEPATSATLSIPGGLCFDTCDNLYFSDGPFGGNYKVRKIDATTGIISTVAGNGTSGFSGDENAATNAMLSRINGICFDKNNNLYIADINNERVRKVSFSVTCDFSLNVDEVHLNTEISIYPNPAHDELSISSSNKISEVTISNLIGQAVYNQVYDIEKAEVNVAGLPPGVYVVRVRDEEGREMIRKFIKE
jgi:sugar lactone lactonase YvrE